MKKALLIALVLVLATQISFGQGRKFLRDKVAEWGTCKNVAMTLSGGDIALTEKNGWAAEGIPDAMFAELTELNEGDELIDDVTVTDNGSWLVLWGDNGVTSYGCPAELDAAIEEWNNNGEVINSITFNDEGDWIMISDDFYVASDSDIMDWLAAGESEYGELWAAHMTNTGLVVVYEGGYQFLGDVPANLIKELEETDIDVYRLKFLSDGAFFIADKGGKYSYYF
ncbi:hypothetical protein QWY85_16915 [Neolewinella lacunae]|uniref:Uncharacterized protein n=1 Tax=Neolewinella lacunae TaxID=1517758 RepID=A0A923PHG1_9BACT|nr:hypothetical protein [Neolewinella lacunae]MBC6993359.1 hypothetical protein [Neolewinella lacunae]MDN3636349.1 hypothetical protein [Neolewinella lacunae]